MVPRTSEQGQAAVAVIGVLLLLVLGAVGAGVGLRASLTRQRAAGTADGAALAAAAVLRDRADDLLPRYDERARRTLPPRLTRAELDVLARAAAEHAAAVGGAELVAFRTSDGARGLPMYASATVRVPATTLAALARVVDAPVVAHGACSSGPRLSAAGARARPLPSRRPGRRRRHLCRDRGGERATRMAVHVGRRVARGGRLRLLGPDRLRAGVGGISGGPADRRRAAGADRAGPAGRGSRRRPRLRRRPGAPCRARRASGTRDRGAASRSLRALRADGAGRVDIGRPSRRTRASAIGGRDASRLGPRRVPRRARRGKSRGGHPGGAACRADRGREQLRPSFGVAIRRARARAVHACDVVRVVESMAGAGARSIRPQRSTHRRATCVASSIAPTATSPARLPRTTTAGTGARGGPGRP